MKVEESLVSKLGTTGKKVVQFFSGLEVVFDYSAKDEEGVMLDFILYSPVTRKFSSFYGMIGHDKDVIVALEYDTQVVDGHRLAAWSRGMSPRYIDSVDSWFQANGYSMDGTELPLEGDYEE